MIRGIKFISVPVKNQDAALQFYTESLGFKVGTDQEFIPGGQRWVELSIPGADTGLSLFTPDGDETASVHFSRSHSGATTSFRHLKCSSTRPSNSFKIRRKKPGELQ